MTRERRQAMQFYILSIADKRKRAAAELYLARYKDFVLGADGRLGFGLKERVGIGAEEEERAGSGGIGDVESIPGRGVGKGIQKCGVM